VNITFYKFSIVILVVLFSNSTFAQNISFENHLASIASAEGLAADDISDYIINSSHTSVRSGVTHYYFHQRYQGIEIYKSQSSIHTLEDASLLKYNSSLIPNISSKVDTNNPSISHLEAIQKVSDTFGYDDSISPILNNETGGSDLLKVYSGGSLSLEDIPVRLMYYLNAEDKLVLCYDLSIYETDFTDWWSLKVDAQTGEIVDQINWVVECNFEHNKDTSHNCTDNVPCTIFGARATNNINPDSYNVYDIPIESPNHGARSLVQNPADPTASPFGWHDTNGVAGAESNLTVGNNVIAQDDQNGNNGSGYRPDGGANLDFDFPIDFNLSPASNRDASLTNLFYWNNIIHDIWYQYGFDEASGNFQENNYGNGGNGSDYVNADGLDGSGTNNANFSTPPDGGNPRMQMYLWNPGSSAATTINTPSNIAGTILGAPANYGPSSFNLTGDVVLADDATGNPTEACNTIVNTGDINGNIALIDRGTCDFSVKSFNAQNAGAIAVIICQNTSEPPFAMAGGTSAGSVTIPSIMISQSDCDVLKSNLPNVNITLESISNGQQIDGSFDNGIVAHEYGHGISNRLTGGGSNTGCLSNTEQMGEGWSDYFGIVMTIKSSDVGSMRRGVGTFALSQPILGGGIRDFPYSTDLNTDPRTYDAIRTASVPHGVGSTWCAMLWEMTWALIDQYGFDPDLYNGTGGNNIAMELVTEGLKLQPCSPGFVDGRDAILAADLALNGGQNECLIWAAFAKRGLGFGATQGSSNSRSDGNESFVSPTSCELLNITKTVDKDTIVAGDTLTYTMTFDNQTSQTYTNLIMSDTLLECLSYVTGSATNGATFNNGTVELTGVSVGSFSQVSFSFNAVVDPSITTIEKDFIEEVENGGGSWFNDSQNPNLSGWAIDSSDPFQGSNSWFAENTGDRNNKFLLLKSPVQLTANSELRFWHTYGSLSNIDGGKVEISTDNQITWIDLDTYFTQNGYDDFLFNDNANPAFGGTGTSTFIETIADLSSLAGEYAFIRFSMFHSGNVVGAGWNIDNIKLTNLNKTIDNIGYFTAAPSIDERINVFPPVQITPATCSDGIQNGTETGVDIGGNCTPSGPCDFDLTLSGDPANSGTFQAQNEISSTANVGPNTNYFANTILLENDFEVALGVDFLAEINPCTAFNNEDELALKVISTGAIDNQVVVLIDINIPEKGLYTIQLNREDGSILNLREQFLEVGIHRVKVKNDGSLIPNNISIIKSE